MLLLDLGEIKEGILDMFTSKYYQFSYKGCCFCKIKKRHIVRSVRIKDGELYFIFIFFLISIFLFYLFFIWDLELRVSITLHMTVTNCHMILLQVIIIQSYIIQIQKNIEGFRTVMSFHMLIVCNMHSPLEQAEISVAQTRSLAYIRQILYT